MVKQRLQHVTVARKRGVVQRRGTVVVERVHCTLLCHEQGHAAFCTHGGRQVERRAASPVLGLNGSALWITRSELHTCTNQLVYLAE